MVTKHILQEYHLQFTVGCLEGKTFFQLTCWEFFHSHHVTMSLILYNCANETEKIPNSKIKKRGMFLSKPQNNEDNTKGA